MLAVIMGQVKTNKGDILKKCIILDGGLRIPNFQGKEFMQ
jgi:hypothetical protein